MAIAESGTAPAVASGTGATPTLSTASFTPPAGSLLVALAALQWGLDGVCPHVGISDSLGGSWQQGPYQIGPDPTDTGFVTICARYVPVSAAVSVAMSTFGLANGKFLAVKVLTGAAPLQRGAALSAARQLSADATLSITPRATGSVVYGLANSSLSAATFSPFGNTAVAGTFVNSTDGTSSAAWRQTTTTTAGTAVGLGGTWGTNEKTSVAAWEIMPVESMPTAAELAELATASAMDAMMRG